MSSEVKVKVSLLGGGISTGLAKVKQQFSKLRGDLNHELGSFLAFGGILAGLEGMIEKATRISNISRRFGAPARELQRVANAGRENGAEMEDVARSWNKLAVNQQKAISGNDEMRKAFADLKVPMQDVANLPLTDLFYKIADSTMTAEDRGKAYAAVVKLMGRNAGLLYTTLELGSGKIKAQGDEIGVMADQSIESLHKMHVQIERLKNTIFVYGGSILIFFQNIAETIGAAIGNMVNQVGYVGTALFESAKMVKSLVTGDIQNFDWDGYKEKMKQTARDIANEQRLASKQVDDIWSPKIEAHGEEHKKPLDAEIDPTDKEKSAVEKIADLRAKLAEAERKSANDQLEAQAKINALIQQRAALLKEAGSTSDEEKKLNLQIDAEHINSEIISAQKAAAKELEDAQTRLDKARKDRIYDGLKTDEQRAAFLEKEIARLEKLVIAEADPKEKLDLQSQLEEVIKKAEGLTKRDEKPPTIAANSLRRIGGQQSGGFSVSGIDDKLLREQTRHGKLLEQIAKNTSTEKSELIMQ